MRGKLTKQNKTAGTTTTNLYLDVFCKEIERSPLLQTMVLDSLNDVAKLKHQVAHLSVRPLTSGIDLAKVDARWPSESNIKGCSTDREAFMCEVTYCQSEDAEPEETNLRACSSMIASNLSRKASKLST